VRYVMRLLATRLAPTDDDACAQCAAGRHGKCNDPSCTCCMGGMG
jgi:hypothetical protein